MIIHQIGLEGAVAAPVMYGVLFVVMRNDVDGQMKENSRYLDDMLAKFSFISRAPRDLPILPF